MGKQIIENILQTPNQTKAININFNVFITHQQHIKKKKQLLLSITLTCKKFTYSKPKEGEKLSKF